MKKISALFLLLVTVLTLVGCSDYKPVKSSDEEAETALTISYDGERYEVPYELYRFFFLNYKSKIDGGDASVWSGKERERYINDIDELIYSAIAEIYAVFHLCLKADIDPHSRLVNDTIETYIAASVEGGTVDGMIFEGHGGDYDRYLASLKERNMNYSVQEILFRYAICSELLDREFDSEISYTNDEIEDFYYSNECARVIQCYFRHLTEDEKELYPIEVIEGIREGMVANAGSEEAICDYVLANTNFLDEIRDGVIISRYSLDRTHYGALTDAALSLKSGEVSRTVKVVTDGIVGYYILYRAAKSTDHLESCYDDVETTYIQNEIGKRLYTAAEGILSNIQKTAALTERDYAAISMG
ncbi:MAG: hypothetical protein IJD51_01465 [Clostridia bacterium]|nr:hypothetical protein [Clostridia bacterium]